MCIKNIDMTKYKLVQPDYIISRKAINKKFIDVGIENNHNFFIQTNKNKILSHNCDGYHISSLIINFFDKWFPKIIERGKLFILITPIVSAGTTKDRKYFYTLDEFAKSKSRTNIRYLKGLGSLDVHDWVQIFNNLQLYRIDYDSQSKKLLNIAFGKDANKRKKWLQIK